MVERGVILTWQKENELKGGIQSQFKALAQALGVKEVSWTDAMNVLGLNINRDYYRYAIVDRALVFKQYLEARKVFGKEWVIADDCCACFASPDKLITVAQNPYMDIAEKCYLNTPAYFEFGLFYTELQKMQFAKSTKIVAVSKYMQDYVRKLGFDSVLIPNGVDMNAFYPISNKEELRQKWGIPNDKKVGIWVGAFLPIKGWHTMAQICNKYKNVFWVLVFKDLISYKPKLKNVKLFFQVPHEQMNELYNCADFFISTSMVESFGIAALEAMSCNLPVIVSNTGYFDVDKEVTDYGFVVKHDYDKAINEMLWQLDQEPGYGYIFKPREHVEDNELDLDSFNAKWKALIEEIEKNK